MKSNKGFTLIELLVVIAIIGILASVVLVSLQSARKKGNDSRVISDVQQIRTELESGYNSGAGTYPGITGVDTLSSAGNYGTLTTDASSQGGAITVKSAAGATAYAIYGLLPSTKDTTTPTNQRYFCIDSTGKTNSAATVSTGATCP